MKIKYNNGSLTSTATTKFVPTYSSNCLVEDEAGQCQISNMSSPLGCEEIIRYNNYPVTDVYKGTGVATTDQQNSRSGVKVVSNVHQMWTVEAEVGDTISTPAYKLPVSCQITLTVPKNQFITNDDLFQLVQRAVGTLYSDSTTLKLSSLVRGALKPIGM